MMNMNKESASKSRKPYIKPCVAVENFALDHFIASCAVNFRDSDWLQQLRVKDYFTYAAIVRTKQFLAELNCQVHADEVTDDMDTLCYHTATSPLFTS